MATYQAPKSLPGVVVQKEVALRPDTRHVHDWEHIERVAFSSIIKLHRCTSCQEEKAYDLIRMKVNKDQTNERTAH